MSYANAQHRARTGGRMGGLLATLAISLGMLVAVPAPALAEVRDNDTIYGQSISERGLSHDLAPNIFAPAALLIDTEGHVYFQRNDQEERKIASTTKIMTALIATEIGKKEDIVRVTEADVVTGSSAYLETGDELTLGDAMYGLMLPSGNDAAMAIARTLGARLATEGQDPYQAFVARMNSRAKELGMEHTLYVNPCGLDDAEWAGDHHSTAWDLGILTKEAMKSDWFREVVITQNRDIRIVNNGQERINSLVNTDTLLSSYEGMLGVKTGMTDLAGYCFVGACKKNDRTYISVILGDETRDTSFADTKDLLQWCFQHDRIYQLGKNDGTMTDDGRPIIAEIPHADWIDVTVPLTVANTDEKVYAFDLNGPVETNAHFETASGDIKEGDVLGSLELKQNGEIIDSMDLIAVEDSPAPSWLRSIFIMIDRLIRSLMGEPSKAPQISHYAGSESANAGNTGSANDVGTGSATPKATSPDVTGGAGTTENAATPAPANAGTTGTTT